MQLQRKLDSYHNYVSMNMDAEALNALLRGAQKYAELRPLAEEYGIADSFDAIYYDIEEILAETYGISEEEALEIVNLEDADYLQKVSELAE